MSDSEASTVPARDEDAKKMALEKLKAARAEETATPPEQFKRKGAASDLGDLSSQPKLPKKIQSKEILKDNCDTTKTSAVKVKKSDTAETLKYHQPEVKVQPTAAKARAQPLAAKVEPAATPATPSPTETPTAPATPVSKAVSQCLNRASTKELQASQTPSASDSRKTPPDSQPKAKAAPPQDSEDESSMDSEEVRKMEAEAKGKRDAHARYMRFSRSLKSTLVESVAAINDSTPVAIGSPSKIC